MRFSNPTLKSLYVMVVVASATLAGVAAGDVVAPPRGGNAKDEVVADADILTSGVLPADDPGCEQGYVDCVDGFVRDTKITCAAAAACNGNCCVGKKACYEFTGKVCKDGSCNGEESCYKANIPFVVDSCYNYGVCAGANLASSLNRCCDMAFECFQKDQAWFATNSPTVCWVRECNICLPCFIQSCFYPCSLFVTYYQKYNREVCWEMEISWRRRQSSWRRCFRSLRST